MHALTHVRVHTHTCTYTHTCTHAHTHTHSHTHAPSAVKSRKESHGAAPPSTGATVAQASNDTAKFVGVVTLCSSSVR